MVSWARLMIQRLLVIVLPCLVEDLLFDVIDIRLGIVEDYNGFLFGL